MTSENWISTSLPYLLPGAADGDQWAAEAAAGGGRGTQRIARAGEIHGSDEVLALLAEPAGSTVVGRRRIVSLNELPVELVDSYYPLRVAGGTALAEPGRIRGGAVTLLADLGYTGRTVQEDVSARLPDAEEVALFGTNEPVLVLTRVVRDGTDLPFQVDVMVTPASLRRYRYQLRIPEA